MQTPINGTNGHIDKQMKTLTLGHDGVESAENQIALHTTNLHTNIRYIQTVSILCTVNAYSQTLYIITLCF